VNHVTGIYPLGSFKVEYYVDFFKGVLSVAVCRLAFANTVTSFSML
jgi:hypothetical protein